MRYSKQREIILQALKNNPVHPTADYIYGLLKKENPSLSLGTVYRNLNLLSKEGVISRISGFGGSEHFDHNTFAHAHILCSKCGKVFDLFLPANFKNVLKDFEKQGVVLSSAELTVRGICKKCNDNQGE